MPINGLNRHHRTVHVTAGFGIWDPRFGKWDAIAFRMAAQQAGSRYVRRLTPRCGDVRPQGCPHCFELERAHRSISGDAQAEIPAGENEIAKTGAIGVEYIRA